MEWGPREAANSIPSSGNAKLHPFQLRLSPPPPAQVAPEQAVKMLQAALPPRPKLPAPVELENVALPLLLPPVERGTVTVALAGTWLGPEARLMQASQ